VTTASARRMEGLTLPMRMNPPFGIGCKHVTLSIHKLAL